MRRDYAASDEETRKVRHLPTCAGVYRMTHRVTGDAYIGSAKNIRVRVKLHMSMMRVGACSQGRLFRHCYTHGFDFRVSVLERCDPADRLVAECWWINHLKPTLNVQRRFNHLAPRW